MPRHRLGAASCLLATPLFLAANVIIGLAWHDPPFNWAVNNISDLGNVTCGQWDTSRPRLVCSPWHRAMADVNENDHLFAALPIFVLGNAGMIVAVLARRSPVLASLREDSLVLGLTGLAGTALFLARVDLGVGVGGMERVAVFPLLLWTVVVALRLRRRQLLS